MTNILKIFKKKVTRFMSLVRSIKNLKQFFKSTWEFIKKIFSKINCVLTIIANISVISFLFLYIIGRSISFNKINDDIILSEIKKQIPKNSEISSITSSDLHGLGTSSIIVTLRNKDFNYDENNKSPNELLIFDSIGDNLKEFYHLFGWESSYTLRYKLAINDFDNSFVWNSIGDVKTLDITGDKANDLIVTWEGIVADGFRSTTLIVTWDKGVYKIAGTLPPVDGKSTTIFNNYMKVKNDNSNKIQFYNIFDKNEKIDAEAIYYQIVDNFKDVYNKGKNELVRYTPIYLKGDVEYKQHYRIDVFEPEYKDNKLEWIVEDSIVTDSIVNNIKYLDKYLDDKLYENTEHP